MRRTVCSNRSGGKNEGEVTRTTNQQKREIKEQTAGRNERKPQRTAAERKGADGKPHAK